MPASKVREKIVLYRCHRAPAEVMRIIYLSRQLLIRAKSITRSRGIIFNGFTMPTTPSVSVWQSHRWWLELTR